MEERADIPPDLPRPDPVRSYWWPDPLDPIADDRTTVSLPEYADAVIVGSGVSGSTIAYNMLSTSGSLKVVMLEARQAASGASGRNGGHTKTAAYRPFLQNCSAVGQSDAVKIAHLEYNCMVAVHDFIAKHNIHCDSRRCDTVDVFYDQAQLDSARRSVKLMSKLMSGDGGDPMPRHDFYSPEETASKYLVPDSLGSVVYEAGSLNAYLFTTSVLRLALNLGLNLQTNTPALSISQSPRSKTWSITTPRGILTTSKLILATNGYTPHLVPALQGAVVPFRGVVTAQRPGSNLPQRGLNETYSFIYDTGYEYMISKQAGTQHEGDVVIGGGLTKGKSSGVEEYGNTDDTMVDADIEAYLLDSTEKFFGSEWGQDHCEGRLRKTWTGIMGYSADGYPFVGPVPGQQGLYLDVSFQGHGMVLCFLCGIAVSEMVLGDSTEGSVNLVHGGGKLDSWFPTCFRVSEERMRKKFSGRLKGTSASHVQQTANDKGTNELQTKES